MAAPHILTAAHDGDIERLLQLLNADSIKERDSGGFTALHYASIEGHSECVKLLLDHGAEVDAVDTTRWGTPLHYASYHHRTNCVQILLDHNADINARNVYLETPLHESCASGAFHCAEMLLNRGASMIQNSGGATALHIASRRGHIECVRILLEYGENRDITDDLNRKPIDLCSADNQEIRNLLMGGGQATKAAKPRR